MATIEKVSNSKWRIRKMYNGELYRTTIASDKKPSKKEAELIINEIINKAIKEGSQRPKSDNMLFRTAAEKYVSSKENSLSPSTIRGYRSYIAAMPDHFSDTRIKDITAEQLQQADSMRSEA